MSQEVFHGCRMQLLLWELEQLLQDLNAHGDGSLTEAFEQHLSATRRRSKS